jgi:hypothetical protein
MVFGEVWVNQVNSFNLYNIDGYRLESCLRSESPGGGLFLYVRNALKHRLVQAESSGFEKIKVKVKAHSESLTVIAYYRPPVTSNLQDFLKDLESEICSSKGRIVFCGDFNIDANNLTASDSRRFMDVLSSYGYRICNNQPTRDASDKCIDHFICNFFDDVTIASDTISMPSDVSDHNMIITSLKNPMQILNSKFVERSFTDYSKLSESFEYVNPSDNVNNQTELLVNSIKSATETCTTTRRFKVKKSVNIQPWYNFKILSLMQRKDIVWSKIKGFKKAKKPVPLNTMQEYRERCTLFMNELRDSQRKYYMKMFSDSEINITWKVINNVLGKNKRAEFIEISEKGEDINDPVKVADLMVNYFTDKPEILLSHLKVNSDDDINKYSTLPFVEETIFLEPATPQEVDEKIAQMSTNKAAGYDGIKPVILKSLSAEISHPLCNIVNSVMTDGIYPACLKFGVITPLHKGEDKRNVANYRPITVTSAISKIVEGIIYDRFKSFLMKKKTISEKQFGFGPGCGTEPAVVDIVHDIRTIIGPKTHCAIVFLDLTAAFDTLVHPILLEKAEKYGFRGSALKIIESFLKERFHAVKVNDVISDARMVKIGSPQGSTFSVFFFIMLINDAAKLPLVGRLKMFIDDLALVYSIKDENDLQACIKHDVAILADFLRINRLTISIKKTKFMVFHSHYATPIYPKEIAISNAMKIDRVLEYKYLGAVLDSTLSWERHIHKLRENLLPVVTSLWKLRYVLPPHCLRSIYFAHFHSRINYMSCVWGTATQKRCQSIQTLQNRALKHVYKLPFLFSSTAIYTEVERKVLPVRGLYVLNTCIFIYKALRNLTRNQLDIKMIGGNRRSQNDVAVSNARTNFEKKDIMSNGCEIFNAIPIEIRQKTLASFKLLLKNFLCETDKITKLLNCDIWELQKL